MMVTNCQHRIGKFLQVVFAIGSHRTLQLKAPPDRSVCDVADVLCLVRKHCRTFSDQSESVWDVADALIWRRLKPGLAWKL